MIKQVLLFVCSFLAVAILTAQAPPQFDFPGMCVPNIFGSDPFLTGLVQIDGVPAEVGVDYVAVLDENDNVIFSTSIIMVNSGGSMVPGFGFRLLEEGMAGCAGYSATEPIQIVIFDASAPECQFFSAANSSFVVTVQLNNSIPFVIGPDGDVTMTDLYNFSSTSCVAALPVRLTSFRANAVNSNEVKLSWTTSEEINNSHFEVERSARGEHWETIGSVAGNGNVRNTSSYGYTDYSPVTGDNAYRLKQVDYDGTFEYSPIALVEISGKGAPGGVQVFPNPITASTATFALTGSWGTNIDGQLLDFSGRTVANFSGLQSGSTTVDLPALPAGVYQLLVSDQVQREVIRVVIR